MTTDLVCGLLCLAISFITNDSLDDCGLLFLLILLAIVLWFSHPASKAHYRGIREREIVTYNAHLELVLQVVSVVHLFFFP